MASKLRNAKENKEQRDKRIGVNCPEKNYHWAEYKSSLLAKHLMDDKTTINELTIFWRSILEILIPEGPYRNQVFLGFINDPNRIKYPVGGWTQQLFEKMPVDTTYRKINYILDNLYLSYNMIYWYSERYFRDDQEQPEQYYVYRIIKLIREIVFKFVEYTRGPRKVDDHLEVLSNQVGITQIQDDNLILQEDPRKPPLPWKHPGQGSCKVMYKGKLGASIKRARYKNDYTGKGSLQCGLSGSVNFGLYSILAALVISGRGRVVVDNKDIFAKLLKTSFIFLVGDGGHNFHEIIYALTINAIVLKDFLSSNLENILKSEYHSRYHDDISRVFNMFSEGTISWQTMNGFILYVYELTKNINPTLDFGNKEFINRNFVISHVDKFLLRGHQPQYKEEETYQHVIDYLATDSNRWRLKETDTERSISNILEFYDTRINQLLAAKMMECNLENLTDYNDRASEIIYAFGSSKKSLHKKKSPKKSLHKKKSLRKKKSSKKSSKK